MPSYLGNIPSNNFVSLKRQVITGNGGSTYTLDHAVASVNDVAIFVNNVRQDPASYSISTTALTLGGTISSSDSCYVIFLGQALQTVTPGTGTVTNAMLGETITVAKGGTGLTSGFKNGITEADMFRLTTDITATNADITSNLERVDDASFGKIGTGMSESSGIFTFPSTGVYHVTAEGTFNASGTSEVSMDIIIKVTQNNSDFDNVANIQSGARTTSGVFTSGIKSCFVNVTDTSNVKVKFTTDSLSANSKLRGDTDQNKSVFIFIRLGDSV
mgnify:FL=1